MAIAFLDDLPVSIVTRKSKYYDFQEELRKNPNKWALLRTSEKEVSANIKSFERSKQWVGFEFKRVVNDGGKHIYCRFVQNQQE